MPKLTTSDVHVDNMLTDLSVAYIQDAERFVADRVFPVVGVQKRSDYYLSYDKADWLRRHAQKRAPATESAGGGFGITTDNTYFCDIYAFHQDVPDPVRDNADEPLSLDQDATEYVTQQLLLEREYGWMSSYMASSIWGTDFTPGTKWDASNGTPVGDIRTGIRTIEANTGITPNTLVLSPDIYDFLIDDADITDRVKYTQRAVITADLLASLFDLDRVLVARAIVDTSEEGEAESPGFMVSDKALLCYAEAAPGLYKPSAGYIFAWEGLAGAGAYSARIKNFRMSELEADRIEGEMAYDHKIISASLGYFFDDVLT